MKELHQRLLLRLPIFSSLTPLELAGISRSIDVREFPRGSIILYQEDTNEYMYSVLVGRVKVYQSDTEGREAILAIRGPGESFGELSLIDGSTEPATVSALEDSVVALVSKDGFHAMLTANEKIMYAVMRTLTARIREFWLRTRILGLRSSRDRIGVLLDSLARTHGMRSGDSVVLGMRLTHQDMAGMCALSRETVTRTLTLMAGDGEISIDGDRRIVLNGRFFEKIALL